MRDAAEALARMSGWPIGFWGVHPDCAGCGGERRLLVMSPEGKLNCDPCWRDSAEGARKDGPWMFLGDTASPDRA